MSRGRRGSRGSKAFSSVVVAIVLIAAAAFGLIKLDIPQDLTQSSNESPSAAPKDASKALAGLKIAPSGSMAGYSREKFPHWQSADDFGWKVPDPSCDARDAALIRDGKDVKVGDGCDVTSGRWVDPYTGGTHTDPSDVYIDHVVPLANAWRSGAASWDTPRRERFANSPEVLLSADAGENRSKGDKGPEAWKPSNQSELCDYATRWIQIKSDYDLSVNPQEKDALTQMLGTCGGS